MGLKNKLRNVDSNKGRTAGLEQRLDNIQKHVDTMHGQHVETQVKRISQQVDSGGLNKESGDYLKSTIKNQPYVNKGHLKS